MLGATGAVLLITTREFQLGSLLPTDSGALLCTNLVTYALRPAGDRSVKITSTPRQAPYELLISDESLQDVVGDPIRSDPINRAQAGSRLQTILALDYPFTGSADAAGSKAVWFALQVVGSFSHTMAPAGPIKSPA